MKTPQQIKNEVEKAGTGSSCIQPHSVRLKENKNKIALFLFIIGAIILNHWTFNMLLDGNGLVRIVGQFGINVPLLCIFFSNKFYKLKEVTSND